MNASIPDYLDPQNVAAADVFLAKEGAGYSCPDEAVIRKLVKPRDPAGHKGTFGHLLLMAGSTGTFGAAILSAKAALRSGCGLLTVSLPPEARAALLTALPEAMTLERNDNATAVLPDLARFNAIAFGPGVGSEPGSLLLQLLQRSSLPLVVDADGLNLLAQNKEWFSLLSPRIILTPHPAEFDRLTQLHRSPLERVRTQLAFSKKYGVIILLKGRYTSVTGSTGGLSFNTTGNSGMATAGSGDVLTGIIGSLLAQGYEPADAAILGAWLHGYAGDVAAGKRSETSLIASDIVEGISEFFREFEK